MAVRNAGVRCAYFGPVSRPDSTALSRADRIAGGRRQRVEHRRVNHVAEGLLHRPPLELQVTQQSPLRVARAQVRERPGKPLEPSTRPGDGKGARSMTARTT